MRLTIAVRARNHDPKRRPPWPVELQEGSDVRTAHTATHVHPDSRQRRSLMRNTVISLTITLGPPPRKGSEKLTIHRLHRGRHAALLKRAGAHQDSSSEMGGHLDTQPAPAHASSNVTPRYRYLPCSRPLDARMPTPPLTPASGRWPQR